MEADGFAKRDTRLIAQVIQRECPAKDPICPREVEDEAKLLTFEANRRIQDVLTALTALNNRLRFLERPKSVVLLSAGLPFTDNGEGSSRAAATERRDRRPDLRRPHRAAGDGRQPIAACGCQLVAAYDLALGLQNIAGATRGEYYAGVGRASGVFRTRPDGDLELLSARDSVERSRRRRTPSQDRRAGQTKRPDRQGPERLAIAQGDTNDAVSPRGPRLPDAVFRGADCRVRIHDSWRGTRHAQSHRRGPAPRLEPCPTASQLRHFDLE